MRFRGMVAVSVFAIVAACGSSDDAGEPLCTQAVECEGDPIAPMQGSRTVVISSLEIGELEDGFDLNHDGEPDNKMSAIAALLRGALRDSLDDFSIVMPIEVFDFDTLAADECIKLAMYRANYALDRDGDGLPTAWFDGDCNDLDPDINREATEVPDNLKDDDCDGLADEVDQIVETEEGTEMVTIPSDNIDDVDGDGVTIADGDCDDTNPDVNPTLVEICGDGLDNDCDGAADHGLDELGDPVCTPFDSTPDPVVIDSSSLNEDGSPTIQFVSGQVVDNAGTLVMTAGPALFTLTIPTDQIGIVRLEVSCTSFEAEIIETPDGIGLVNGRLGGVIAGNTADQVRGLDFEELNLRPEDSLLDATFANVLGLLLGLSYIEEGPYEGCYQPDIDVDGDGLEAFCDSDPTDLVMLVDVCIDGDGSIYYDELDAEGNVVRHCTEHFDNEGNTLFPDGISLELNFEAVPSIVLDAIPE